MRRSWNRWLWCTSFVVVVGCAGAEDIADGGTTSSDALFGCTFPPCDGPPLPPPQDMAVRDPDPEPAPRLDMGRPADTGIVIPDDCDPGTRIGPCALCNLQGTPEMPDNDANCPPIDCGGNEVYERVVEGEEEVCYVTRRMPLPGNCRALGECHDDPLTFCGEPAREEVERFTPGPCISMSGCEGATPPDVEQAQPGAPCNGTGLCDVVGECTVSEDCASFPLQRNSQLCDSGTEVNGEPYCEFFVAEGRETDCNTFCLANNWRCAQAWNDADVCVRNEDQQGCGQDWEVFICRCTPL